MKQNCLKNGLSVVYGGYSQYYDACLGFNVGHLTEPRRGLAQLFERVLLMQNAGIIPYFGGAMTAYTASGNDFGDVLQKVAEIFSSRVVSEEKVEAAKKAILRQANYLKNRTVLRVRQAFKRAAFGVEPLEMDEAYLGQVCSYSVQDVLDFAERYYSASNAVLYVCGPDITFFDVNKAAEKFFGRFKGGEKHCTRFGSIYCGGGGVLGIEANLNMVMTGWSLTGFGRADSSVLNVLLSLFSSRLSKAYWANGLADTTVEVKVVSCYGERVLRVCLMSETADMKVLTDIFVTVVKRICRFEPYGRLLEKCRNTAVAEQLDCWEKPDNQALGVFLQRIGRFKYDIAGNEQSIYEVSGSEVLDAAKRLFKGAKPAYAATCVSGKTCYSYQDLLTKLDE